MASGLETNVTEMWENFRELTGYEMDKAIKRGLKKAATAIKKKTVENARAGIKTYNNDPDNEYTQADSILDAPRVSKIQDWYDEDSVSIKVHVMGPISGKSQGYRFRFLEKGTKEREVRVQKGKSLKTPRRLGSISPRWYFRDAKNSVDTERIFIETIDEAIAKINSNS